MVKSITVIMPSYNQAQYLDQALCSVLNQNHPAVQTMVIDGGSTDGSRQIIEQYVDQLYYWCSEKDEGQTAAINNGIKRSDGEIIGWINSDDVLLPGALDAVSREFENPDVMWVSGWIVSIDVNNVVIDRKIYPQVNKAVIEHRSVLPQPGIFWRRSVTEQIGLLDETLHWCMDLDYWIRMIKAGFNPTLIPRYQAGFRIHQSQKTDASNQSFQKEFTQIFKQHFGRLPNKKNTPYSWRLRYKIMKLAAKIGWAGDYTIGQKLQILM